MIELIAILVLAIVASLFLGLLLGKQSEREALQAKIDEAYNQAKAEAEREKAGFSLRLSEELTKVRESIVKSVEAYDGVVRLVEERLPTPIGSPFLRLEEPLADNLLIPFQGQGINGHDSFEFDSISEQNIPANSDSAESVAVPEDNQPQTALASQSEMEADSLKVANY